MTFNFIKELNFLDVVLENLAPLSSDIESEVDIQHEAIEFLRKLGYIVTQFKSNITNIDKAWPSKKGGGTGEPDIIVFTQGLKRPICVWENKNRSVSVTQALDEAKYYIEGLRKAIPNEPSLPRIAVGFNGEELLLSYYNNNGKWISLKMNGEVIKDCFPCPGVLENGASSEGVLYSLDSAATNKELRGILNELKTIYRTIAVLSSGRRPIDFTIALITIKMLVEQNPDWGTWADQPVLAAGAESIDHSVAERLNVLYGRVHSNDEYKRKYGDIFDFKEHTDTDEIAFSFVNTIDAIPKGQRHFERLYKCLDKLPPLRNVDFDIFSEVYQFIGDEATKKKLGQFFTGRHIISGVLPIFFEKSGLINSFETITSKKIADIACGTGGFLTETFRFVKRCFPCESLDMKSFAEQSFFGYDISQANASRARVNMYFAGDGFSHIEGNVDSLQKKLHKAPSKGFDIILTNPPYGQSSYGRAEEAFLKKTIELLKPGEGWGLIILPVGTLENSRSAQARFNLLKNACVSCVISLPKHAFAPYTLQRTAIVIFRKRKTPIKTENNNWQELLRYIGEETIGMYIVDNDGYANSDKRYPTDRKNENGKWLHNDLSPWIDKTGLYNNSSIFDALISGIQPSDCFNEFGQQTGEKYAEVRLKNMLVESDDSVHLIPDRFLRPSIHKRSIQEFEQMCSMIISIWTDMSKEKYLITGLIPEIEKALLLAVEYDTHTYTVNQTVEDLFLIKKGNSGFTEEIIYRNYDSNGMPVYGGGASAPRFRVTKETRTKSNKRIGVFCGPAIIVSLDGSSGSMHVINSGEFCVNHHGVVLIPYDPYLDLDWFAQQCEQEIKSLATNKSGSATLTIPKLANFPMLVPLGAEERGKIGNLRRELSNIISQLIGFV